VVILRAPFADQRSAADGCDSASKMIQISVDEVPYSHQGKKDQPPPECAKDNHHPQASGDGSKAPRPLFISLVCPV